MKKFNSIYPKCGNFFRFIMESANRKDYTAPT